jgi:hypothetical protein
MKALYNGIRSLEEEPILESIGDVEDVRRVVLSVYDRDARPILTKLGEAKGLLAP